MKETNKLYDAGLDRRRDSRQFELLLWLNGIEVETESVIKRLKRRIGRVLKSWRTATWRTAIH